MIKVIKKKEKEICPVVRGAKNNLRSRMGAVAFDERKTEKTIHSWISEYRKNKKERENQETEMFMKI